MLTTGVLRTAFFSRIIIFLIGLCLIFPLSVRASSAPLTPVTLQLRWDHQFQFAGYYAADWLGYYEEEGIQAEIRTAFSDGKILDATEEVSQGRAKFGVGAADILIAQDQGMELTLVASFFQRSAVAYYALDSTPVTSVYDLVGLNMARREHDLLDVELQALFLNEGIHPFTAIHADVPRDFTVEDLTSGRYDLVPGYLGKIPYEAEKLGIPIRSVHPINYGIDFYGDSLFTATSLAESNPELVEGFRRATIKGWAYALEHPEEIADRIAAMVYEEGQSSASLQELVEFNRYQASRVLELSHYPIVEIGNINPHRWGVMAHTLKNLEIINSEPDLNTMIFDYQAIRLNQLRQTGESAATAFIMVLLIATPLLIFYLKRRNTLLKLEIEVRHRTEDLLKNELEENRRKESLILYQARMAAMGEMVGNIAHQWRQPLNTLRLIISNLQDSENDTVPDDGYTEQAYRKAHTLIEKMSVTIDDFRYFSNPLSDPHLFEVLPTLNLVIELLEEQLKASEVDVSLTCAGNPQLFGMDNHLSHAVFNILTNAVDALGTVPHTEEAQRRIMIGVTENDDDVCIEIADNGPGILPENALRIFDMYFTTHSQSGGTGLGLYMAKTIVENSFHGKLTLKESAQGACFLIQIPKETTGGNNDRNQE